MSNVLHSNNQAENSAIEKLEDILVLTQREGVTSAEIVRELRSAGFCYNDEFLSNRGRFFVGSRFNKLLNTLRLSYFIKEVSLEEIVALVQGKIEELRGRVNNTLQSPELSPA